MNNKFISTGCILAALAVALGAFGAHGLKSIATEKILNTFETAVRYQMYHSIALIITGILMNFNKCKLLVLAGWLFCFGIFLFSASLYFLVFFQANNNETMNWLGAITPLGGVSFIAGWVILALAFLKLNGRKN